jgi:hypothetical protein
MKLYNNLTFPKAELSKAFQFKQQRLSEQELADESMNRAIAKSMFGVPATKGWAKVSDEMVNLYLTNRLMPARVNASLSESQQAKYATCPLCGGPYCDYFHPDKCSVMCRQRTERHNSVKHGLATECSKVYGAKNVIVEARPPNFSINSEGVISVNKGNASEANPEGTAIAKNLDRPDLYIRPDMTTKEVSNDIIVELMVAVPTTRAIVGDNVAGAVNSNHMQLAVEENQTTGQLQL